MLHAHEPDWVAAPVGLGVAVEQIPHCLVKVTLAVPCSREEGVWLLGLGRAGKNLGGREGRLGEEVWER
jgi:hypothetical protein